MKKNILAIIILAATLVNLTLTALMLFVYLPNAQSMNNMIMKICEVIDLELESPLPVTPQAEVLLSDLETYVVDSDMQIALAKGEDGGGHFALVTISVSLNKKADDYATVQPLITSQSERIKAIILDRIGSLTAENFMSSKEAVLSQILETLQAEFGTKCIYRVDVSKYLCN